MIVNTVKKATAIVFAFMFILTCGCTQTDKGVTVSSNSFFDKFIIKNDRVYMICYVEFVNDSDLKKTFSVRGESAEDAENGLLTAKNLEFFILDTDDLSYVGEGNVEDLLKHSESMTVAAHSTVQYYVCFVGEHGGGDSKHDRNLPKIVMEEK